MSLTVRVRRAVSFAVIVISTLAILAVAYLGAFRPADVPTGLGVGADLCAVAAVAFSVNYLYRTRRQP